MHKKQAQLDSELHKAAQQRAQVDATAQEQLQSMHQELQREKQVLAKERKAFDKQFRLKMGEKTAADTTDGLAAIKRQAEELLSGWREPEATTHDEFQPREYESNDGYNPTRYQGLQSIAAHDGSTTATPATAASSCDVPTEDQTPSSHAIHQGTTARSPATSSEPHASSQPATKEDPPSPLRPSSTANDTQPQQDQDQDQDQEEREDAVVKEVAHPGGKRERWLASGKKQIVFADGNVKEIAVDGRTRVTFTNGDRKEFFPATNTSVYTYCDAATVLTTHHADGTKVYEFPTGQVEKTFADGRTEIWYPDGERKTVRPNGDELVVFLDGTTMLDTKDGTREVTLRNRRRVRYFADRSIAWVTPDGREHPVRSDAELQRILDDDRR